MISARNERACERARAAHFAPALALIRLRLGRVRATLGHADAGGLRCQRLAPEADPRGVSYRSLSRSKSSLVRRFSTGDWCMISLPLPAPDDSGAGGQGGGLKIVYRGKGKPGQPLSFGLPHVTTHVREVENLFTSPASRNAAVASGRAPPEPAAPMAVRCTASRIGRKLSI